MPIPDIPPSDKHECEIVRAAESLRSAADSFRADNRRSWLSRHEASAVAIATLLVGLVSWVVHQWTRTQIARAVAPIHEAQNSEIKAVENHVDAVEAASHQQIELLQQNDEDFVNYVQAADSYEQRVLEDVAEKLRVKTPDRTDVDKAAKRLDEIKERRRQR